MKKKNKITTVESDIKVLKEVLIECVDVEKWYETQSERISVLKRINMVCKTGDFISVFGVKGSGKTTFAGCIAGLEKISRGKLYVKGELIELLDDTELSELHTSYLGLIPEERVLIEIFSVKENLEFYAGKKGRQLIEKAIDLVGLGKDILFKTVKQLTRFEEIQVILAQVLLNTPKIIVIDSIDTRLGREDKVRLVDLLSRINHETNAAIILMTDDLDVALRTKKILKLTDGKLV